MIANTQNPSAAQIAEQFKTDTLEPRQEMMIPYGRDTENQDPSPDAGSCEEC